MSGGPKNKPGPAGAAAPGCLVFGETTVVLGPAIWQEIAAAQAGDVHAWGELYGQAGALIAAQLPIPEPLASVIAERMAALAAGLTARRVKDVQKLLPDLVVPAPKPRRRARKPAAGGAPPAELAAQAVLEILDLDKRLGREQPGRVEEVVAACAQSARAAPTAVRRAMTNLRKRRAG